MMKMTSEDLRKSFLNFFQQRGHTILPSVSLIPHDPTLLLTIAGMVPFKPIFLGKVKSPLTRVTTSQKCVRVNDLENVGYTARHHTFFEMLGNFSFGDYFKKEVCPWAWEFLTGTLGLSPDRMWVSVHHKDRETCEIWKNGVGVPAGRIVFLGDDDNFWASGPVGPCGFCSEIYYDTGEKKGCGKPECGPGCSCDRYLEVWNLVFMEFDRKADGSLEELPHKNIDTGMGLERLSSVVQGTETDYETDLFLPLIHELEKLSGESYQSPPLRSSFRIVADHIRAITFLLADGVYPSNEGRGYVLRRLVRRAFRYGGKLSIQKPFLHELLLTVVSEMGDTYPELLEKKNIMSQLVLQEETRFEETLQSGLSSLEELIHSVRTRGDRTVSGKDIFRLYDTFGFPAEVAEEILSEERLTFNKDEFLKEMESQKGRARFAQNQKNRDLRTQKGIEELFLGLPSEFVGYDQETVSARILALSDGGQTIATASAGESVFIVCDRSPFYAERGGQEGDTGTISSPEAVIKIEKVIPGPGEVILHQGKVEKGSLQVGDQVTAAIDARRRRLVAIHHTATHLLHQALRQVLGHQVKQAGSWIGESGLRFDFTHFAALNGEEIQQVEEIVNQKIFEDLIVRITLSTLEAAQKEGVTALFEEKYAELVRIVRVGDFSAELCGGTHLPRSSEIGLFKIVRESSVGSGLRRIEAVAGPVALQYLIRQDQILHELKNVLGVEGEKVTETVKNLGEENKRLGNLLQENIRQAAVKEVLAHLQEMETGDAQIFLPHLFMANAPDIDYMKIIVDQLREQIPRGMVILGSRVQGKISGIVAGIHLPPTIDLNREIRTITKKMGGGGGGKANLCQFGGIPESQWDPFIQDLKNMIHIL